jgi:hypothetical protein
MEKSIHTLGYQKLLQWLRNSRKERGLTMREVGQALPEPKRKALHKEGLI